MVDAIGPSGQVQNVSSVNKSQKTQEKQGTDQTSAKVSDEISISSEALNLADVESTAQAVASGLSQNVSATLSGDVDRLNALL